MGSRRRKAQEQDKATRQIVASLMLFDALGGEIDSSFTEFEDPLVALLADVTAQLRDREQLAALSRSAEALNSTLDLDEVLVQAMRMLVDLTGAERAFFVLADQDSGDMQEFRGINPASRAPPAPRPGRSPHPVP